jgi:DNA-binding winged helix-turn-helix (wHTH) protein/Tol biopolymer transport system component
MSADPSTRPPVDYYFGPYRFDGRLRRLYKDEELVVLTPKAADTLVALVERAGRLVEKDELFRAVWGDIVVGDDTLAQNISTLRRVLGDEANRSRFIATVPRHGYRFVAPVRAAPATSSARASEAPTEAPFLPAYASATDKPNRRLLALIGVTALVAAAVGGSVAQRLFVDDQPRTFVQFTISEPEHWRFPVSGGMLALSPNGEYLTFIAVDANGSSSLWLRPLASAMSRLVAGTEGAKDPFWSPDSRSIAFFSERRLKAIDVMSGAVRVIASLSSPRSLGATWSRNGQILFSVPDDGMYVVPASGGVPEPLAPPLDTECCSAWPDFLPDGRRFLYTVPGSDPSASGIYVGEIGNPHGRRLLDAMSSSTHISPGLLSFARSGTLYLQRFDTRRLRLTGEPVPVFDSVAYNARTGRVLAATSEAGVIAFRKPPVTELVWVDRAGKSEAVAAPPAAYLKFSIAPDGRRAAAARLDPRTGKSDVWVFDEGREVRVTDNPDWDSDPVWTEDGRYVVYSSRRGDRWQIYRRLATAVGAEELLLDSDNPVTPLQVLRSTQIVYAAQRTTPPFDVWKLERTRPTPLTRIGGFYPSDARFSPDERWLAYGMPQMAGNVWEQALYVSGNPFGEHRREIAQAASMPRWRADGHELFYLSKDSSIVAISIDPQRTPSDSAGHVLFRGSGLPTTGISGNVYDVTPDGQRFLLKREVGSSPIHVVLNWDARLDR